MAAAVAPAAAVASMHSAALTVLPAPVGPAAAGTSPPGVPSSRPASAKRFNNSPASVHPAATVGSRLSTARHMVPCDAPTPAARPAAGSSHHQRSDLRKHLVAPGPRIQALVMGPQVHRIEHGLTLADADGGLRLAAFSSFKRLFQASASSGVIRSISTLLKRMSSTSTCPQGPVRESTTSSRPSLPANSLTSHSTRRNFSLFSPVAVRTVLPPTLRLRQHSSGKFPPPTRN